jgi:hypothetical protein
MGRSALAVIAGFLAMSGFAFLAFSAAFVLMGQDGVFHHGTYETSGRWEVVSAALGLVTALVGGVVCGSIGLRSAPIWALVGLAVVFGVTYAALSLAWEGTSLRSSDVGLLEAQLVARSSTWLLLANPVIDAVGITLGGLLAMRGRTGQPATRSVSDASKDS